MEKINKDVCIYNKNKLFQNHAKFLLKNKNKIVEKY